MNHLPTILEELEHNIQRRELLIAGVDAQGIPRRWEDPAVVDVRCISTRLVAMPYRFWVDRVAFVQYGYTLRAVLAPFVIGEVTDEIEEEVRSHIIAGGRRHVMKGDL